MELAASIYASIHSLVVVIKWFPIKDPDSCVTLILPSRVLFILQV